MRTGNQKGTLLQYLNSSSISTSQLNKIYQNNKALQAQDKSGKFVLFPSFGLFKFLKRVSFRLSVPIKASVTVEAAIAIPIFMFCFLEVISLLQSLSVYSGVLFALKNIGTPISVYGYVYEELTEQEEDFSLGDQVISSLLFSETYLDSQIREQCSEPLYEQTIQGGVNGISLLGSYVDKNKGCLYIMANYYVEPLFSFTGRRLRMSNQFYAKLWTGYTAVRVTEENYVYITENGTVYHLASDCTHLKLSISSIKNEALSISRNDYGEKYKACDKCCEGEAQKVYYITKKGNKYHKVLSCSGLKRTVSCVPKSTVEDWPLCEKCSQKGE